MLIVCVLNSQFSFLCLMFCVFWFKTCFSVSYLHLQESGIFPVFMYPTSTPYTAILECIILSRSSIVFARRSTARIIITGLQGTTIRSIIPPHVAGMYHPMYSVPYYLALKGYFKPKRTESCRLMLSSQLNPDRPSGVHGRMITTGQRTHLRLRRLHRQELPPSWPLDSEYQPPILPSSC